MSGLFLLTFGLLGQWLLGVAVAHLLLSRARWRSSLARSVQPTERLDYGSPVAPPTGESDCTEEPPWAELAGLGLVLGIGLTAWGLFVWSLCGGMLGRGASLTFTAIGFACGGPVVWKRLRSSWPRLGRAANRQSLNKVSVIGIDERREAAWCRLCQWLIGGLAVIALAQTLLTPQHFWDERSIFAIKGLVLSADGSIRSPDLLDPDFVQYHPRYPLLIPLAEQHVYALLGRVEDRLSKIVFPLLSLGLVLTMAGVLSRRVKPGAAWLFALLLATVPVLVPYELGFLSGQADAPMACFHGLAMLYLWDACTWSDSPTPTRSVSEDASASEVTSVTSFANAAVNRTDSRREAASSSLTLRVGVNAASQRVMAASIIAGLCGALAAFTKDEGIAFLLVDCVALSLIVITRVVSDDVSERGGVSPPVLGRQPALEEPGGLRRPARKPLTLCRVRYLSIACRARLRVAVPLVSVVVCAVIVHAPWFVHRRGLPLTTEMNYFGRASFSLAVERWPVLAWEMGHLAHRMFWEWSHWGLHWWLMLVGLVIAPRRVWSASQIVLLLDVVGSLLALMVAGMLAPAQLDEHIGGSSPRFLMQLVPVAVLFAAGQLAPRREASVSPEPNHLV